MREAHRRIKKIEVIEIDKNGQRLSTSTMTLKKPEVITKTLPMKNAIFGWLRYKDKKHPYLTFLLWNKSRRVFKVHSLYKGHGIVYYL